MNIDQMRPLYRRLKDPIAKAWLNHVWLNAHVYQKGWIQAVTGGVREGKSMTDCTLADLLCMHELDEYNFGFTPKEYLKSLDVCKTGEPLIWSELGTAVGSRKWQSLPNILMGEVVQTMMIRKPIVFLDVPDMTFADVQIRKLIYSFSESKRWGTNPVKLWLYNMSIERKEGQIFYPHPLVRFNGSIVKVLALNIKCKTPEEVWIKYNERQIEYKNRLRKKNLKMIEDMEKELSGEGQLTVYDMANEAAKNPELYKKNGVFHIWTIQNKFRIGYNRAAQVRSLLEMGKGKPIKPNI